MQGGGHTGFKYQSIKEVGIMKKNMKLNWLSLAVFFVVWSLSVSADAYGVKTGGGGTAVAEDSIVPHDYIIIKPDILPCIHHSILDNFKRLDFSPEQQEAIHKLLKSPVIKEMAMRARKIQALEEQAKKRVYSGTATRKEMKPLIEKIAALRVEHTLRFLEIQNTIFDMLSPQQYEELRRILAEKGI